MNWSGEGYRLWWPSSLSLIIFSIVLLDNVFQNLVLNSGDTGTAATMIDLPETTIYVIGDYGDVDFISQDAVTSSELPVQYIQNYQAE